MLFLLCYELHNRIVMRKYNYLEYLVENSKRYNESFAICVFLSVFSLFFSISFLANCKAYRLKHTSNGDTSFQTYKG